MYKKSNVLLISVFLLTYVVTGGLLYSAYSQLGEIYSSTRDIIDITETKRKLVTQMFSVARERSLLLLKMYANTDPFELDDLNQQLGAQARIFIESRNELLTFPLSDAEKKLLLEQGKLATINAPLQVKIANLIMQDKRSEVNKALFEIAIPRQNGVQEALSGILNIYAETSKANLVNIEQQFKSGRSNLLYLAVLISIVSFLIFVFIFNRLKRGENLFQWRSKTILSSISDAVIVLNDNKSIESMNSVAESYLSVKEKEVRGKSIGDIYQVFVKGMPAEIDEMSPGNQTLHREHLQFRTKEGEIRTLEDSLSPILDSKHNRYGYLLIFRDVTEKVKLHHKLSYDACHDALTTLMNRKCFLGILKLLLERNSIDQDKEHVLIYMDLDQFKIVNDSAGHAAGDDLLRQVSFLIKGQLRERDYLARLGGDEFVILIENASLDVAELVAYKIGKLIQEFQFIWDDHVYRIGISSGITVIKAGDYDPDVVLHKADVACYQAKALGRNRFEVYVETDAEASEQKIDAILANDILEACDNDDFILYRQLIVECNNSSPSEGLHYEILLRLKKSDQSILPPGAFIPAAERMKLMPVIDRWVVEHTLIWLAEHPSHLQQLSLVAINLSGQTLADQNFGRYVEQLLEEYKIPAEKLCFEITETAAIARLSEATKFIAHMKGLGCKFSLDDFGSGLSSFTYLKTLDIDFLKIDGAFVKDIVNDENDYLFVDSINRIGHGLGKKTIAEFVETDDIRDELKKIGVDYVQGYGISYPIALSEV